MREFFFEAAMETPRELPFAGGRALVFTRPQEGRETPNEDAAALLARSDGSGLLVVCDGAGGLPAGARAARTVIERLDDRLRNTEPPLPLRSAVLDGVEEANARLLEDGQGAGCTLAAVELDGPHLRPYHVGDSQALVVGQRGRLKLQTLSHSPVGFAQESGLLAESDALVHEDRHLVSNLVGTPDMRIEVGAALPLARFDTLLLASDGLFDNLYTEELLEMIRRGPLAAAAGRLIARIGERMRRARAGAPGKADDLTFILYRRDS